MNADTMTKALDDDIQMVHERFVKKLLVAVLQADHKEIFFNVVGLAAKVFHNPHNLDFHALDHRRQ